MKKYRRVVSCDTEECCKVWRKTDSNASSGKSENLHFHVLALSIGYKVSAKKYRRIISHDTEKRFKHWRKTEFLFEKWYEEFGKL